jgi:hypothetical protein
MKLKLIADNKDDMNYEYMRNLNMLYVTWQNTFYTKLLAKPKHCDWFEKFNGKWCFSIIYYIQYD